MDTSSTVMGDGISPTDGPTRGDKGALQGLAVSRGLNPAEALQIEALADEVLRADGVGLKLNLPRPGWNPTAEAVPAQVRDLCFYDGGQLVGYSPLDAEGGELEVTAAVLPSHRRRGLFRLLLDAARREAQRRGVDERTGAVDDPAGVGGGLGALVLRRGVHPLGRRLVCPRQGMAQNLRDQWGQHCPERKVLGVCGNYHSRLVPATEDSEFWPSFAFSAQSTRPDLTVRSINVRFGRGAFFNYEVTTFDSGPENLAAQAEVRPSTRSGHTLDLHLPEATPVTFLDDNETEAT